jgi:hypothetical protein
MSDEMIDSLGLVGIRQQALEKENRRLRKEAEAARRLILRMDRKREGLLRMANQLRMDWAPANPGDPDQKAMKDSPEAFNKALSQSIEKVIKDEAYCARREREIGGFLDEEVGKETALEDARMAQANHLAYGHRLNQKG